MLMKTVEKMITQKMSVINLNMIQIIKGTLVGQRLHQGITQEQQHYNLKNNVSSPITQPLITDPQTNNNLPYAEDQTPKDSYL